MTTLKESAEAITEQYTRCARCGERKPLYQTSSFNTFNYCKNLCITKAIAKFIETLREEINGKQN